MPVNIKLDDKYKITSDSYGYTVSQFSHIAGEDSKNPGEEVWRSFAHYGDLRSMLVCLPDRLAMRDDINSLGELLHRLKYWQELLRSLFEWATEATILKNE